MNAFAGFVGLVGSGKETLFSVEGGNHRVTPFSPLFFRHFFRLSEASPQCHYNVVPTQGG